MKKIISLVCAGIVVLGTLFQTSGWVNAATTTITLENKDYETKSGDEVTIKVYLNSDTNIGAYHAELIYDKYRLQYIDGGDSQNDGKIILEGTGYGETIVYKLVFKAVSGGKAEISCIGADIRVEGVAGSEKQQVLYTENIKLDILGEDTAVKEQNYELYGIESTIPLAGVVDTVQGERYYIVDHLRYVPDIVDFEYRTVKDVYENAMYTFLTNPDNDIRLLYMIDSENNFVIYSYSKSKEALYPCEVVEANGAKYYVMSPNACDKWAEELTLDYVKKENICYAMKMDGTCGFYKYEDGKLSLWTEDEGQAFLDEQMKLFYGILVGATAIVVLLIVGIIVSSQRKQAKKSQKKAIHEDFFEENSASDFGIEFIDIDGSDKRAKEEKWKSKEKPVIAIKDVTMRFRISTSNVSGLKELIIQKLKKRATHREFIALDHVSINIYKGEVVGIIGTNGSGKSTLLRLVSGALNPSSGKINVDKHKVQLLTLGTGFDAELTARENIYLSGAIIGYTREFIDENFEKIVEFAELQDFVDEKVKNFSSGMVSRLGFAIATIGDAAEILILDEILSVGDEFFRKKSLKRVNEMIHGGSTVIMVAHGMGTILENCTKVVWLEKGKVKMVGDPKAVCRAYRKFNN